MIVDWYDNIDLGVEMKSRGRTVTEADVVNFAMLSGDWNPLHTNEVYASETGRFGARIAHGMLVLSIMSGLIELRSPYVAAFYGLDRVRFLRPTFIGDTVEVSSKVVEKTDREDGGIVALELTVSNQRSEPVMVCTMKLFVAAEKSNGQRVRTDERLVTDGV